MREGLTRPSNSASQARVSGETQLTDREAIVTRRSFSRTVSLFLDTQLIPQKLEVVMHGAVWNATNLRGKNAIKFRHKCWVSMKDHFSKQHLLIATAKAQEKFSQYGDVTVVVQEKNKRADIHKELEQSLVQKYGFVPNQNLRRHYNPLEAYRLFTQAEFYISGERNVVLFSKQGAGEGMQLVYAHKSGPWIRESALVLLKSLFDKELADNSITELRKHIREIEGLILKSKLAKHIESSSVQSFENYISSLDELASIGLRNLINHNQQALKR